MIAIVVDGDRLLLVEGVRRPGQRKFPSGPIELGEPPREEVARELVAETGDESAEREVARESGIVRTESGLQGRTRHEIGTGTVPSDRSTLVQSVYRANVRSGSIGLQDEDIRAVDW